LLLEIVIDSNQLRNGNILFSIVPLQQFTVLYVHSALRTCTVQ